VTRFCLDAFDSSNQGHLAEAVDLWNAASGADLAITLAGVRFNTRPSTGAQQAGRLAVIDGQPAGFVLATEFSEGDPRVSAPEKGWIDAIAVAPVHQGRGIGTALMDWAEGWLAGRGCTRFQLGGSLRPFAPGLPSALATAEFFRRRGYAPRAHGPVVWDVARDLRTYRTPPFVPVTLSAQVRPARAGDDGALLAFLEREFGGRWFYEAREFLAGGGRISDFVVLLTPAGVDGFCWLTLEDSARSLDRCFMARLPRPWGQLGPIGISAAMRGGGYGAAVLDAGLRRLRDARIAGCVIDWTDLLHFYGKFGFATYRSYEMLAKDAVEQERRLLQVDLLLSCDQMKRRGEQGDQVSRSSASCPNPEIGI